MIRFCPSSFLPLPRALRAAGSGPISSGMGEKTMLPVDPRRYGRDRARVERGFWDKVRRTMGRVPFVEDAVAAYFCAIDKDTPLQVKAILMGALAYFVMPADLIPDFIAWMGFTDDAMVLAAAIRAVAPHIGERHHRRARAALDPDPAERAGARCQMSDVRAQVSDVRNGLSPDP